jgi:predicted dithiol-disulfide oxidoreductase (DUF899 family)
MHRVVSREQWIAEPLELLAEEKEFTRRRDALAEKRRALPWVRVDKHYEFDSAQGRVTLAGLFRDKSQLFVQHLMQGPNQPLQCVGCALGVDGLESLLPHFENHDVSVVAIARATTDISGNSVFYKDESGAVYHTYSNYSRGGGDFMAIYRVLEITPKGRNENGPHFSLTDWARPHNMYGKGGEVAANGRFTPPASCCM